MKNFCGGPHIHYLYEITNTLQFQPNRELSMVAMFLPDQDEINFLRHHIIQAKLGSNIGPVISDDQNMKSLWTD